MPKETGEKLIVQNKKARHDYNSMSSYASQLHEEQQAVDRAYGRLDDLR